MGVVVVPKVPKVDGAGAGDPKPGVGAVPKGLVEAVAVDPKPPVGAVVPKPPVVGAVVPKPPVVGAGAPKAGGGAPKAGVGAGAPKVLDEPKGDGAGLFVPKPAAGVAAGVAPNENAIWTVYYLN